MTSVFIVILNWNGKENSIQCLESIGKLQISNFKLQTIVVDNASIDGSVQAIKQYSQKFARELASNSYELRVIKNASNLGFAAGNNIGIRRALKDGADFVLILNNDTIVEESLITDLLKVAHDYKDAGVISPKIYFAPGFEFHKERYQDKDLGKVIWYAGGKIDWSNVYGSHKGVDEVDRGQYEKIEETDFTTGAAMFLRREAIKDAGMFDEKYFMYLEDADLSMRMKKHGWKVLYAPPAHLWHKVARSSAIGSELNDYYITRNRLLFGMRYAPFQAKFALVRESLKLLLFGREWQKRGVLDFYFRRFGKGTWK